MAMIGSPYTIPEENLPKLRATLDKILRKAKKLGLEPIEYEVGEPEDKQFIRYHDASYEYEEHRARVWETENRMGRPLTRETPGYFGEHRVFVRRFYPVVIYGKPPQYEGWTFVGKLQPLTDDQGQQMNILRVVRGWAEPLPSKYRTMAPDCDHCHLKRRRLETYIVHNGETGEYKQVGSSCIDDFLAGADPQEVARILEWIFEAMGAGEDGESGGGSGSSGPSRWSLVEFLTWTAAVIRVDGWMSRGSARARNEEGANVQATADVVIELLSPSPPGSQAEDERQKALAEYRDGDEGMTGDIKMAEDALAYAKETLEAKGEGRSDYEHNLYVAISQTSIDKRLAGITASVVPFYTREVAKRATKVDESNSQHFGTEGEKIMVPARLLAVIPIEGMYTSFLHRFITSEGNVATWFASHNQQAEIGAEYLVVATVKKHDTYRGVKQTILTRATLLEGDQRRAFEEEVATKAARAAAKAAGIKLPRAARKLKATISSNPDPDVEAAVALFPATFSVPSYPADQIFRINGPKSKKIQGGDRGMIPYLYVERHDGDGKWKKFADVTVDVLANGYGVSKKAASLEGLDLDLSDIADPQEWIISDLRDVEYGLSALRPYFEEKHVGGPGDGIPQAVEEELNEITSVIDDVHGNIERAKLSGYRIDRGVIEDYNLLLEELRTYVALA